jgi:hypothetical protein
MAQILHGCSQRRNEARITGGRVAGTLATLSMLLRCYRP